MMTSKMFLFSLGANVNVFKYNECANLRKLYVCELYVCELCVCELCVCELCVMCVLCGCYNKYVVYKTMGFLDVIQLVCN